MSLQYDYLLVVGPGRSGSTFLYELLKRHPDYAFPEIKEGYYYRSPRLFDRLCRSVTGSGRILVDVANLAYRDARLTGGVEALRQRGARILLVALLRNHRDRAVSMIRYAKSRGRPAVWMGARMLEERIVRERLTPADVRRLLALDADLLFMRFDALTRDTRSCLGVLTSLCGSAPFTNPASRAVNESVAPRNLLLASAATLVRTVMRRLGFRRTLQSLKDTPFLQRLLFAPLRTDDLPALSPASERALDAAFLECSSIIGGAARQVAAGVHVRRANAGACAAGGPVR